MSWSIGFDERWKRDIGYGVPAICDYPHCTALIDRGLSYVCCGEEPYGGDEGCGLYFCTNHHNGIGGKCYQCSRGHAPFNPKPDIRLWLNHKKMDPSWQEWRDTLNTGEIRHFLWVYQEGLCAYCDKFVTEFQAHMHEKVPRGKGGKISLYNSIILCSNCHLNVAHGSRRPRFKGGKQ